MHLIDLGLVSGRGAARAEDAQGTPTQSHISPSILVYEDNVETNSTRGELGYPKPPASRKSSESFSAPTVDVRRIFRPDRSVCVFVCVRERDSVCEREREAFGPDS